MDRETLDRASAELMRRGQFLEAAWLGACTMLLPRNATEAQLRLMRAVFFCGAKCFHTALQYGDFDERWANLAAELDQWDVFMRERATGATKQ